LGKCMVEWCAGKDRYKIGVKFVDFDNEQDIKLLDYLLIKQLR